MTQYAAQAKAYPSMPDFYDHPSSIVISGYDREPATPNPDDCAESYQPVTLEWTLPDNGIYHTMPVAHNGWRGNRVYHLTTPGATNTYGIMVNGLHIPIQFTTARDAQRFAQHIEDDNTES